MRPIQIALAVAAVASAAFASEPAPLAPAAVDLAPPTRVEAQRQAEPPPPTPAQVRAAYDERLASSGDTPAAFHRDVATIVESWAGALPDGVELGAVRCYQAGCAVEQISDGALAHEQSGAALASDPAFHAYAGWRARTGPETGAGGRIHVTWYFLAPTPS